MRHRMRAAGTWAVVAAVAVATAGAKRHPHYLAENAVDWKSLLNDGPPATGSEQEKADVATVLQWQEKRTASDVARCKHEDALSPFTSFSEVIGDRFDKKTLPLTATLLRHVETDTQFVADAAKDNWHRPRPPVVDPRIKPCVGKQESGSFPSSHAARGAAYAAVLAELFPDKKTHILDRGEQIGEDRVIAGIHFPSDVAAGQKLGKAVAEKLLANPTFVADLAAARAECQGVVAAKPTTAP